MPACDIIIPIWNQPALTQRCLESVEVATHGPYRLILVDNGSEAPTRALLDHSAARDPQRVRLLRNTDNLGFIKAVNQGIRASSAPYVCLLNNDTVVTEGWLEEMLRVADQDATIGLVNPASTTFGYRPPAPTMAAIQAYAAARAGERSERAEQSERGRLQELATGIGFCLLIKRPVLEAVGLFDEAFGMGNFEDADFSKRAAEAGYRCVLALGAYVYHEEKASFKQQPDWQAAFRANQQRYYQRWGRPLRIVWECHADEAAASLVPVLAQLLRQGHWVWHSTTNGTAHAALHRYTTMRPLATGRRWRWGCLTTVLLRRKKPIDLVITHDRALVRWLRWFHAGHHAVVLYQPSPAATIQQCQRLSHSR